MRRHPNPDKNIPYESGIPPLGTGRERFSVKFYMVAMLFIVFDIETVFMLPWGAHFRFARAASAHSVRYLGIEHSLPTLADIATAERDFREAA